MPLENWILAHSYFRRRLEKKEKERKREKKREKGKRKSTARQAEPQQMIIGVAAVGRD